MEKTLDQYTKKDFEALPPWDQNGEMICDSIVLLPTRKIHKDSGYRCMDVIAVIDHKPVCRCSG